MKVDHTRTKLAAALINNDKAMEDFGNLVDIVSRCYEMLENIYETDDTPKKLSVISLAGIIVGFVEGICAQESQDIKGELLKSIPEEVLRKIDHRIIMEESKKPEVIQ